MKEFDDIIKGKIANLPSDGQPDWDKLNELLDGESFDSALRAGMSKVTPSAPNVVPMVVGWDQLNDKLNILAEATGDAFDQQLAQKLANAEVAFSSEESWQQLSHRLDTFWSLRRKLVRYRVLEIAIAASLFFTLVPLLRDNPITQSHFAFSAGNTTTAPEDQAHSAILSPAEINQLVNEKSLGSDQPTTLSQKVKPSNQATTPFGLISEAANWISLQFSPSAFAKTNDALPGETALDQNERKAYVKVDGLSSTPQPAQPKAYTAFVIPQLPASGKHLLPLSTHFPAIVSPKIKQAKWSIGASAGVNIWQINTPKDITFNQESFSRPQSGFTIGTELLYSLSSKSQLGLGLFYTPVSYDPEYPTILQQNVLRIGNRRVDRAETFEAISLDIVQVPLEFRYNILPDGKRVKLWMRGGLVGNFAMNTAYELETDFVETALTVPGTPVNVGATNQFNGPVQINRFSPSETKPFVMGVAETGVKSTNTFLSGRVGMESQVVVNDKLQVFGSVDYSQFLPITEGIGPNYDKLNSFGLSVGARISL